MPLSMQAKMTPLMQQYWEIKSQHPDKVVLFRMGDFFEMFHQDAETAAPILNIALTSRNKKSGDDTKMCGVPHHSIATPIAKLLAAGHKVAICDQIEDPALAKGLVKRAVTRVLTPGMVYDPDTLDQLSANYLVAYQDSVVAFADVTTGEAFYYEYANDREREELIAVLSPVEMVITKTQSLQRVQKAWPQGLAMISEVDGSEGNAVERLKNYISKLQGENTLKGLEEFQCRRRKSEMRLSATVLRHLEIFTNGRGGREGTLFSAIHRGKTWAGGRLLKNWLSAPLVDADEIRTRQDEIAYWLEHPADLKRFREGLAELGDIERRLGKVHTTTFNARDLKAISESILVGERLVTQHPRGREVTGVLEAEALARKIERALNDELPTSIKEGGMIRQGFSSELDELILLTKDSQALLLQLEEREKMQTGISSLKVRYNNVFGFYIELTKTHAEKAPSHYRRKQTLTNAERFTTDELDRLEEKVLSARSKRDQLELKIFLEFREMIIAETPLLLSLARIWTKWDVLAGLAWLAAERGYARPLITPNGHELRLELCRHPVVEQTLGGSFVPNTVEFGGPGDCLLLTGPNMAGKSTLMRQVALNVILAQIGSFLPAESATVPLFDEIFTRVGASDALDEGLSTFMVEMTETAEILLRVNARSLVVMDEIGRGTSTYDGLSLAQAILEYLVAEKRPYLLFATHYHELTGLEQVFPQIHNVHMSVQERGGQIQFLHSLAKGAANRSYGIHVAKLAGLPTKLTNRAQSLLKNFEERRLQQGGQLSFEDMLSSASGQGSIDEHGVIDGGAIDEQGSSGVHGFETQGPMGPVSWPSWISEFKELNLSQMTPLEALNKLYEWQREASS